MPSIYDPIIEQLLTAHPQLKSWDDPVWRKQEMGYKLAAANRLRESLGSEEMRRLIEEKQYGEIMERARKLGAGAYLLYNSTPSSGDLSALYAESLDAGGMARSLYDLIYGDQPSPGRIDTFVGYLRSCDLPIKWSFVTFWLFLSDPHRELLIRPSMMQHFLRVIGEESTWQSKPSGSAYERLLSLAGGLRDALGRFGETTMLHVHGVIYVAYASTRDAEREAKRAAAAAGSEGDAPPEPDSSDALAPEFTWMFGDRQTAETMLDLFAFVCERLGVRGPDDRTAVMTWTMQRRRRRIRLTYGNALVLSAEGYRNELECILIAIRSTSAADDPMYHDRSQFSDNGAASGFALARVDAADLLPNLGAVRERLAADIASLRDAFAGWSGSPFSRFHDESLFRTIFDRAWRAELLVNGPGALPMPSDGAFSWRTFEVMAAFAAEPTTATWTALRQDFDEAVRDPFHRVFRAAVERLPGSVLQAMEHGRGLFSRIPKNDFGRGGIHSHYWGAIYPKGGKRTDDAQLHLSVDERRLRVGFYVGLYGSPSRERLARNARRYGRQLAALLQQVNEGAAWVFGEADDSRGDVRWAEFFEDTNAFDTGVSVELDASTVVQRSEQEIVDLIAGTWAELFPLVLLTTLEDPIARIKDYLTQASDESAEEEHVQYPEYPLERLVAETGLSDESVQLWLGALERKGQVVLYGPPGTGKTWVAERLARHVVGGTNGMVRTVQFHPAYAYEDFMEGMRPERTSDGQIDYRIRNGLFVQFCADAARTDAPCVLIVDEINRANLARVFGELMYLLEYRDQTVLLPSGQQFGIPANVRLIGTMNTADRSIALVDHALRRRFAFLRLAPDYELLRRYHSERGADATPLIELLHDVNRAIDNDDYSIGISFFMRHDLAQQIRLIWETEIVPYLEEYFFDQADTARRFSWDTVGERLGRLG